MIGHVANDLRHHKFSEVRMVELYYCLANVLTAADPVPPTLHKEYSP